MSLTRIPARTPRCELGWPPAVVDLCSELADGRKDGLHTGAPELIPCSRLCLLLTRDFHKPVSPGTDAPLKPELSTHCQFYSSFVNIINTRETSSE